MDLTLIVVIDRRDDFPLREAPLWGSHRERVWGRFLFWVDGWIEFPSQGFS